MLFGNRGGHKKEGTEHVCYVLWYTSCFAEEGHAAFSVKDNDPNHMAKISKASERLCDTRVQT